MGQFDEALAMLMGAVGIFAAGCRALFFAIVAGLLVVNGIFHDGLRRLQALEGCERPSLQRIDLGKVKVEVSKP